MRTRPPPVSWGEAWYDDDCRQIKWVPLGLNISKAGGTVNPELATCTGLFAKSTALYAIVLHPRGTLNASAPPGRVRRPLQKGCANPFFRQPTLKSSARDCSPPQTPFFVLRNVVYNKEVLAAPTRKHSQKMLLHPRRSGSSKKYSQIIS
jgi:hypothetical protein